MGARRLGKIAGARSHKCREKEHGVRRTGILVTPGTRPIVSQLRKRLELRQIVGAVGDGSVFIHIFKVGKNPQFLLYEGSADVAHIILAAEGLLGFGGRIINGIAGVQVRGAVIKRAAAVPVIGAAARGNDDGASVWCARYRRCIPPC